MGEQDLVRYKKNWNEIESLTKNNSNALLPALPRFPVPGVSFTLYLKFVSTLNGSTKRQLCLAIPGKAQP